MKSRKCPNCACRISGPVLNCPVCNSVFKCKKCGKELTDYNDALCPLCKANKKESRHQILKHAGEVFTIGMCVGITIYQTAKISTKNHINDHTDKS